MTDPFYPWISLEKIDKAIGRGIERGQIDERDAELLKDYVEEYRATRHIGDNRAMKMTYDLVSWRRFIRKPFNRCTFTDISHGINSMMNGLTERGKPYEQNTKHDYIKTLKIFLLWLIENGHSAIPEAKVRKIRMPAVNFETTSPDEILTVDEVTRLIRAARTSRNRAIIATTYEIGARIGEAARLRWKDLVYDQYGIMAYVTDSKTRKTRYARLLAAVEYIGAWRNEYPTDITPDSFVFISKRGLPMQYRMMSKIFQNAADKAGIGKRVNTHLMRKSHITHMSIAGYPDSVIKEIHWGNQSTQMFRTYIVLARKNIDDEVLARAGIKKLPEDVEKGLQAHQCPTCFTLNGPTSDFCTKCARPLTEAAIQQIGDKRSWLHSTPEFEELSEENKRMKMRMDRFEEELLRK